MPPRFILHPLAGGQAEHSETPIAKPGKAHRPQAFDLRPSKGAKGGWQKSLPVKRIPLPGKSRGR
jgi:hypothetical protein